MLLQLFEIKVCYQFVWNRESFEDLSNRENDLPKFGSFTVAHHETMFNTGNRFSSGEYFTQTKGP